MPTSFGGGWQDLSPEKKIYKDVTILDGGMGHAVRRYGVPIEV